MNGATQQKIYEFCGLCLDLERRQFSSADGQPILLTARVFNTLTYFVEHRGQLLDKSTLMEAIWPDTVVEENNLNQAISTLRKALGEKAGENRYIVTEPGRGYRFVAKVRTPIREPRTDRTKAPAHESIAVLPFVNMSPDPDQEYFADGVAEELLNQLSHFRGLHVAGRTSSFYFKNRNEELHTIGEKLGVAHILEGSVRKENSRVRITAQLVNISDGYRLWSESFDRELIDIFAIQEDIARTVAAALSVTLGLDPASNTPDVPLDVELYDIYLRGRAQYYQSGPTGLERSSALFAEVLGQAPEYAPARAGLVDVYIDLLNYVPERRVDTIRALEALATDEPTRDDWATHYARSILHFQRYEWVDAERAFTTAIRRAPPAWLYTGWIGVLIHLGRINDAIGAARRALNTDPLSSATSYWLQVALYDAGRRVEAEAEYQRSLDFPGVREPIEHLALFRALNEGDGELVRTRFQRYLDHQFLPTPALADVREALENRSAALAVIRAAYDDPSYQDPTRQFLFSWYAAHYGDDDLALNALRRAVVDLRGANFVGGLWWPDMAVARQKPAFKEIVRDLGLVDYWRTTGNWSDFCRPVGEDDFECE